LPFCPRCGKRNLAGAEFCSKCGGSLAQTDETELTPPRHTRLGIASLILGMIAFFTCLIPTFIFGILAVAFGAKCRKRDNYGFYGLILGLFGFIVNILALLAYLFLYIP
jgi:uncharacterized membrane protein YvbJ